MKRYESVNLHRYPSPSTINALILPLNQIVVIYYVIYFCYFYASLIFNWSFIVFLKIPAHTFIDMYSSTCSGVRPLSGKPLSWAIIHPWEVIVHCVPLKVEKEHDRVSVNGEDGRNRLPQPIDPVFSNTCPASLPFLTPEAQDQCSDNLSAKAKRRSLDFCDTVGQMK